MDSGTLPNALQQPGTCRDPAVGDGLRQSHTGIAARQAGEYGCDQYGQSETHRAILSGATTEIRRDRRISVLKPR